MDHGDGSGRGSVEDLELTSGELCLDLVNTGSGRIGRANGEERLRSYGDLVRFAERTGTLSAAAAAALRRRSEADPAAAAAVLEQVRVLREAMARVFGARIAGQSAPPADLSSLAAAAGEASRHQVLVQRGESFELEWTDEDSLDRPWWPAAMAAVSLLTSPEVVRVKECASETCDWLFLDLSKNRSRRWCDMKDCGNRAKARRYYQRKSGGS